MTNTERELLAAAQTIGGITLIAEWASADRAAMIDKTGKTVGDLTVSELLEIDRECRSHGPLMQILSTGG